jgi:hypothetical protein
MKRFILLLLIVGLVTVVNPVTAHHRNDAREAHMEIRALRMQMRVMDARMTMLEFQTVKIGRFEKVVDDLRFTDSMFDAEFHSLHEWRLRNLTARGEYVGPINRDQIVKGDQ